MSNQSIPKAVLSEQIQEAIAGRPVKAAVYLTFQFDPGFFEEEILPVLFDLPWSHIPKIRLVQLEEVLRQVNYMAVYYDRAALAAEANPAQLDYRRIGLTRSTGYFHPKNILLLLENCEGEKYWESLIVVTLSANLTRAGWWENVEVAHIEEIAEGEISTLREDLRDLLMRIKRADKTSREHPALDQIRSFLSYRVNNARQRTRNKRWLPHFYTGQQSVPEFLRQFIQPHQFNLEIISPYFDDTDAANVLANLLNTLKPKETRLYLPEGKDGAALCRQQFFKAVERLRVKWGKLPSGPLRPVQSEKGIQPYRFVHAKVYRFWNQDREIFFVGSVNLTQAAHQSARAGNFETGILIESEVYTRDWWLEPLNQDKPTEFRPGKSEDTPVDEIVGNLSLRFNWASEKLDYFWEIGRGTKPRWARVAVQGAPKFTLEPIIADEWVELPAETAGIVKQLLKSTSLVEVMVDDGSTFRVLIEEEGMAHKPSILLTLSAEEILQYWSLLSAEQREAFINERSAQLAEGTELALPSTTLIAGNTMFDRFAGIFHAFGRLEHHIQEALENDRENEAVYRLFGQKYDSLPSLIEKVAQDEKADRVNRYVTLLCARQLLQKLEKNWPDFNSCHQAEFEQVHQQLSVINEIQAGFTFSTESERQRFFNWFEKMFFMEIPIKEQE
jgi:hypothetical protein